MNPHVLPCFLSNATSTVTGSSFIGHDASFVSLSVPGKARNESIVQAFTSHRAIRQYPAGNLNRHSRSDFLCAINGIFHPNLRERTTRFAIDCQDSQEYAYLTEGDQRSGSNRHVLNRVWTNDIRSAGVAIEPLRLTDQQTIDTGLDVGMLLQNMPQFCSDINPLIASVVSIIYANQLERTL